MALPVRALPCSHTCAGTQRHTEVRGQSGSPLKLGGTTGRSGGGQVLNGRRAFEAHKQRAGCSDEEKQEVTSENVEKV